MNWKLTLALLSLPLSIHAGQKTHEWLSGKVLGADATEKFVGYYTTVPPANSPFPATSKPVWKSTHYYLLETPGMLYLCAEAGAKLNLWTGFTTSQTFLIEGTTVRFYIEGDHLIVVDNTGHPRRETLLKQAPPSEAFESVAAVPPRVPLGVVLSSPHSTEHVILHLADDGSVLVLDDETVWQIDPLGAIAVILWLPGSRVTVVPNENRTYTLVHLSDGKTAKATPLE